jgi:hypothetical protein
MSAALLDTCVLWPSLQRDVLLSFAVEGLYRPVWSSAILEELKYSEERKLIRRGAEPTDARRRAQRLITTMRSAFDDAEADGWQSLEGSYGLPDPDDEHVVAAAVVGGAGVIVTSNLRHFPIESLPAGIEVQSPAVFAHHAVSLNPIAAMTAIEQIAARSGAHGPPRDVPTIIDALEQRYNFVEAAAILRGILE